MIDDPALIEKAKKRARELFDTKRSNCAEAVFLTIFEMVESDLPPEVSALLTPLGGGVAVRGENCGALLGGVIALGLAHGRKRNDEEALDSHRKKLWKKYSLYNQLPHRFQEKFGSTQCWELTRERVYGTRECHQNCAKITAETAGMVVELLLEAQKNGMNFEFKKVVLEQSAKALGMSVEELISYKTRGEYFPEK